MTVYCAVNYKSMGKLGKEATKAQWAEFNNGFTNVEKGDPKVLLGNITSGNSFCPRHSHIHRIIQERGEMRKTTFRHSLNWLPTSVAALDYDDGATRMTQLQQHPLVAQYANFGYTTVSHTEEHERFRIVFVTERPVATPEAWRSVMGMLAAKFSGADRSGKDIVKAYAGNPLESVYTFFTGRTIPMDVLKNLVLEWRSAQEATAQAARATFHERDPTAEDIREILRYIPNRMDYLDWVKALMAVHSVMPGEDGIRLCEEWSPGFEGEIKQKFKSFGDGKVSFGWLVSVANSHGYNRRASRVIGSILSRGRGRR